MLISILVDLSDGFFVSAFVIILNELFGKFGSEFSKFGSELFDKFGSELFGKFGSELLFPMFVTKCGYNVCGERHGKQN